MPNYFKLIHTLYTDSILRNKEVNLIDVISRSRGWNPLDKSVQMIVHIDDKEYVIRREK